MIHCRSLVCCLAIAAPSVAQVPILDVTGGSLPGEVSLKLSGGEPGTVAAIFLGANTGPTPISLWDPRDPRFIDIGLEMIDVTQFGLFDLDGCFAPPIIPVPNLPQLIDVDFYFQGLTLPGLTMPQLPTLVGEISALRGIRMGPAGQFRDRSTQLGVARAFAEVLPRSDGTWMIIGGGQGGLLSQDAGRTTEIYDPIQDVFTPGPLMVNARSLFTATELMDGRWLITGGVGGSQPQNTCEIYDPVADEFTPVASMTNSRMGHTATLLGNGKVLVSGGLVALLCGCLDDLLNLTATTEIYDPSTNQWSPGPPMTSPRIGHMAIPLADGRIALAGGASFIAIFIFVLPVILDTVDWYDPDTNRITPGAPMNDPRLLSSVIALDSQRVLVAGGISILPGTPTTTAEILHTMSGNWQPTGSMSAARTTHFATKLDGGRFLHMGGTEGSLTAPLPLQSTEFYDANTGLWQAGPPMNTPRAAFALFVAPTGQIHILGGSSGPTANSTEWYYR